MKAAAFLLLLVASSAWAGLDHYAELIVADSGGAPLTARGVRVTYLGVNGYLFQAPGATLLVDPYFTRSPFLPVAFNVRQQPSEKDLRWAEARLPRQVNAILITHGHFDHLLDAPALAEKTGAQIIGSRTSAYLARAAGAQKTFPVRPGMRVSVGTAMIRVLPASHDCIFGRIPFPGTWDAVPSAPVRPSDWVCGEPLAYLIEIGGKKIYLDSGGTSAVQPPANLGSVDLAILGVALPDSRARLPATLERLRPRFVLPSHQDHFFRPVQEGFVFGPLTDFPEVRRLTTSQQLILLDYFRPWTIR